MKEYGQEKNIKMIHYPKLKSIRKNGFFRYGDYIESYNYNISSPNFDKKTITNGRLDFNFQVW